MKAKFVNSMDSHVKKTGVLDGKFEKTLRSIRILFCGRGLNFFSPLKGTNLTQQIISCHIFSAQYPKKHRKSSRCGPFEAEHPNRYQTAFSSPERYDEHSRHFYMGVSPGSLSYSWQERFT